MPNPPPPPNADLIESERRAATRRAEAGKAKEAAAEAQVERLLDEQLAKFAAEDEIRRLRPEVEKMRTHLRPFADAARKHVEKLRDQIKAIEAAAGDLEGSIITAGETAKHDPKRALAALERAWSEFEKAGENLEIVNRKS
jgi:hypothetical protein